MNACCAAVSNPTTPRWVRRVREIFAWVLPSAILVLVPKCPVCLAAYVALWTGISHSLATATYLCWVLLFLCVAYLLLLFVNRLTRPQGTQRDGRVVAPPRGGGASVSIHHCCRAATPCCDNARRHASRWRSRDHKSIARVGPSYEWHLVFVNPFCHLAFHLCARLCQPAVVIAPHFSRAWFVTIWSVSDSMSSDGIEEGLIHT
jgi:hypothetical protein